MPFSAFYIYRTEKGNRNRKQKLNPLKAYSLLSWYILSLIIVTYVDKTKIMLDKRANRVHRSYHLELNTVWLSSMKFLIDQSDSRIKA